MENEIYTPETAEEPVAETPVVFAQQPVAQTAPTAPVGPSAGKVMALGIVGLALAEFGVPGIIVSAIGKKKARAFQDANGSLFGMAKVGSILSKVGLIVAIVMTVVWAIYLTFMGLSIAAIGFDLLDRITDFPASTYSNDLDYILSALR